MLFAKIFEGSFPDLMVGNAQRDLLGSYQQGGMIEETLVGRVTEDAQSLGGRVMGKIKLRGILNGQNRQMIFKSFLGGLLMRGENILIFDLVIIKESVGRFGNFPMSTGLRDRASRVIGKDLSDQGQAFGKALVAQFGLAKFYFCPGFSLILRHPLLCPLGTIGVGNWRVYPVVIS